MRMTLKSIFLPVVSRQGVWLEGFELVTKGRK